MNWIASAKSAHHEPNLTFDRTHRIEASASGIFRRSRYRLTQENASPWGFYGSSRMAINLKPHCASSGAIHAALRDGMWSTVGATQCPAGDPSSWVSAKMWGGGCGEVNPASLRRDACRCLFPPGRDLRHVHRA